MDVDAAPLIPIEPLLRPGRSDVQQFDQESFHRWYNFVLGFSDQLVEKILVKFSVDSTATVLDPFCGTGTTMVECAKRGIPSIGIDANPFAVFAARVKSRFDLDPDALMRAATRVENRYHAIFSTNRRFTDELTYRYLQQSGMLDRGWISKRPLRKALVLREAISRGRKPSEELPGHLLTAWDKLLDWQKSSRTHDNKSYSLDQFTLFFTTKVGPHGLPEPHKSGLIDVLEQNVNQFPPLKALLKSHYNADTATALYDSDFDSFLKLAVPKALISRALFKDWLPDPELSSRLRIRARASKQPHIHDGSLCASFHTVPAIRNFSN